MITATRTSFWKRLRSDCTSWAALCKNDRPGAGRPGTRRASETVLARHDASPVKGGGREIPYMIWSAVVNRKAEGQVEITVIEGSIPTDIDLIRNRCLAGVVGVVHNRDTCNLWRVYPECPFIVLNDVDLFIVPHSHVFISLFKGNQPCLVRVRAGNNSLLLPVICPHIVQSAVWRILPI